MERRENNRPPSPSNFSPKNDLKKSKGGLSPLLF
ncbi:hypothetical protein MSU_0626 [Mycoplasma suis str. Illinois]|uniref:Uncharacterized protein n=1 Tax=Mycoplasma suis (strain Illinois) TaxID=768700 RepID=F0QRN8_MYCSL|nr:hypothetical protein MSU_0626 [Mycoplasma suis str. Illinois]